MIATASEFVLPRTGGSPVLVRGELVAIADDAPVSEGRKRDKFYRWHRIEVYAGADGERCRWYVSVQFCSNNVGFEKDRAEAWGFATREEMVGFLEYVYSPLAGTNFPNWPEGDRRSADVRIRKMNLIDRWHDLVVDVLVQVSDWEQSR